MTLDLETRREIGRSRTGWLRAAKPWHPKSPRHFAGPRTTQPASIFAPHTNTKDKKLV